MTSSPPHAAVIGGGPAGLMAAEVLASQGVSVDLFDAMPSVGRKFLLAGRGGLNLTHSEPPAPFLARYGAIGDDLREAITGFGGEAVRRWAGELGIDTFVGTSGRVFPTDLKAAPLLRAWLHRLRAAGVRFHTRHRWVGWDESAGALAFDTPNGRITHAADATVLALGGASWPRLGSDGAWVPLLQARGVAIAPLQPANCGFDVSPTRPGVPGWSDLLRQRFAGQPVKPVAARMAADPPQASSQGEFVVTDTGIEGSLVYAFSARLRDEIAATGQATWLLDLLPQHDEARVLAEVRHPRGPRSLSTHLKSRLGIAGVKAALLHEVLSPQQLADPAALAAALKALPIRLVRARPVAEAISTAGGVRQDALDAAAMLRERPGVFCAGEMLDWEAPTGGYLLTACLATGRRAGFGAARWLGQRG
ncbi:NAD(P)/FAD-dependent oxidoreductase [Ramlibacter sp. Leaf400]|uniref:NAD(P)/FAD-dependent oxidoreductase n=1 Tax=Ramlibacter sp. Leaf400 TaxID=1736365 RepID=UPI0006FA064C|nr:TIGR03862 family flavoprotein [Ramlibacter sp. Leaf400]KQT11597.1 NAD(FAD)-utilizing dehydrogenase [Ramlibacter sp. Leaf400]